MRARYWKEALQIFDAHPLLGVGADGYETARLRYRTETLDVRHAHGFVVQTLADLGLVGLARGARAARRLAGGRGARPRTPFNRRWTAGASWRAVAHRRAGPAGARATTGPPLHAERIGLLSMLCVVSCSARTRFVDWTWYVPGDACVALLCAGWLAGRGPLTATAEPAPTRWRSLTLRDADRPCAARSRRPWCSPRCSPPGHSGSR